MTTICNKEKCLKCVGCVGICPQNALDYVDGRIVVSAACTECGLCVQFCPVGAMSLPKEKD